MTSASAVSRVIRTSGHITTSSLMSRDVRVTRGHAEGTVSVRVDDEMPARAQRTAKAIEVALTRKGYVIDMHSDLVGMTVSK